MTRNQAYLFAGLGALAVGGVLVGRRVLSAEQQELAVQLASIGLVGSAIGIPLGLWAVPAFEDRPWIAALILTAASYGTKAAMLPHGESHEDVVSGELAEVYA